MRPTQYRQSQAVQKFFAYDSSTGNHWSVKKTTFLWLSLMSNSHDLHNLRKRCKLSTYLVATHYRLENGLLKHCVLNSSSYRYSRFSGTGSTGVSMSVYLEGVGYGQTDDAWTDALPSYDGKQGSRRHNAVSYKLQADCQPPWKSEIYWHNKKEADFTWRNQKNLLTFVFSHKRPYNMKEQPFSVVIVLLTCLLLCWGSKPSGCGPPAGHSHRWIAPVHQRLG